MIRLSQVSLRRGTKALLTDASVAIHPGHRVGVVGPNGCGKSSLFAMLMGELAPDAGDVHVPDAWTVAHVEQEASGLERSALAFVIDGDAELRTIEAELERPGTDGHRLAELHGRFDDIGGHSAPSRAATLMNGLGFSEADQERPVQEFSGGWRVRVQLAKALMSRSDLLLLDEPTNHLDLDAVLWLESWLRSYPGTLLVISHDREFLDNVVHGICHFDNGSLKFYPGGYSAFERTRAEQLAHQQAMAERQEREIAHLQSFVDRFRAKATKARQAQSRLKALDRMEIVAKVQAASPFSFEFQDPGRASDPLLLLDRVDTGYGDTVVLRNLKLAVRPGSRIGLLGRNGAGKSTLVRLIAGELPVMAGDRQLGRDLRIGYFAQHQLTQLRMDESPLWHVQRLNPAVREQDLRDFLGGFNFRGEGATAPVGPMSGGEKARLCLALIVYTKPHLLLLDEPTNHLDMDMRNALTLALQSFTGAMILVSHDRALLRAAADELWLVADGALTPFDGDLEDYRIWLEKSRATGAVRVDAPPAANRREVKRQEAQARERLAVARRPIERRLAEVERKIEGHSAALKALEMRLAAPDLYDPSRKEELKACLAEQATSRRDMEVLEAEWLELHEKLEAVAAES